jgi:hypothetical protein
MVVIPSNLTCCVCGKEEDNDKLRAHARRKGERYEYALAQYEKFGCEVMTGQKCEKVLISA